MGYKKKKVEFVEWSRRKESERQTHQGRKRGGKVAARWREWVETRVGSRQPVLLASISARLSRFLPLPSTRVDSFSVHADDLYIVRAPFAQHFHYASRVMMRCMNYANCLNI